MGDFRKLASDFVAGFHGPLKAIGWIAITVVLVACLAIVLFQRSVPEWSYRGAQLILVGASTAIFTRFMGGMGMFRDAIADVLGQDGWLDRRNDLPDLWRRITRRIFLPGFREDGRDAEQFLVALNAAMTKVLQRREKPANYYQSDMRRRIRIDWHDQEKRIVRITDRMTCDVIPFDARRDVNYEMTFNAAPGGDLSDYNIMVTEIRLGPDQRKIDPLSLELVKSDNKEIRVLRMSGEEFYLFSRTLVITQKIDLDPLFFVPASRVVWGLNAIITFDAQTMQVAFEEVGVAQEFTPQTRGAGELEWDTRSVLLPDQGFVIVMATTPRATHVEGRPDT